MNQTRRLQRCTICGSENDILRLSCADCGATLRDRVAALNLFETAFAVLAEPGETFIKIARSEQRNYMVALLACSGFLIYTISLYIAGAGDAGIHFGLIVMSYAAAAPAVGLASMLIAGTLAELLAPHGLPGKRFRLAMMIHAWSLVPFIVASTLIVFVQLSLFGATLFSHQNPAFIFKPEVFWTLFGVQCICVFWSVALLAAGLKALGIASVRAWMHTIVFYTALAACVAGVTAGMSALLKVLSL